MFRARSGNEDQRERQGESACTVEVPRYLHRPSGSRARRKRCPRCFAEFSERDRKGDSAGGFIAGLEAELNVHPSANRHPGKGKSKGSARPTAPSRGGKADTSFASEQNQEYQAKLDGYGPAG